ncbi:MULTISPECIES: hypothetical protein [unclassified Novosphingobium]|uniref:hypothetical protein n=1 Tax=unclassified Novosphingobium TaxID=2644732 RepID=UPI00086CB84E|nr:MULTISPECIES: hypothetical protein [unclassified Novosphingobium]MBN9145859.1 hypothetical protein [Novosphingobium sp.]MDR6710064.1 putative membrane protein [Novosphingobium sp. 1748]ODU81238.1 MAG: hypothetical protein ABT10_14335 [Novosphingobium sp. SCN 63-17]OJX95905.1 MAG: hypothetical protein BGP00_16535 [Novosphingobium sp. 63-713]
MGIHPNRAGIRRHRLHVFSRAIAAILGGYVVTSLAVACLARLLPMRAAEASIAATLVSFAIYAGIIVTVFSARSMLRVWISLGSALLLLGAGLYVSILTGERL